MKVAQILPETAVEIVKRSDMATSGFVVLPMRFGAQRLRLLNRCAASPKGLRISDNALAFLRLASIRLSCCASFAIPPGHPGPGL